MTTLINKSILALLLGTTVLLNLTAMAIYSMKNNFSRVKA